MAEQVSYRLNIDGINVPSEHIYKFWINFSMDGSLPKGELVIVDKDGSFFANFRACLGSVVDLTATSTTYAEDDGSKTPLNSVTYESLIVSKIRTDATLDKAKFGGYVILTLEHKWSFYKDYTPHAYSPMKISKLIDTICKDKTRGIKIQHYVNSTDDKGNIPRYKTGESDYDFIMHKLLPFALINGDPAYFYCNQFGNWVLNSFKKLYSSSPTCVIGYTLDEKTNEIIKKYSDNINSERGASFDFANAEIAVGGGSNVNYIEKLKLKIYFEDMITHKVITGVKSPTTILSKENGKNSGNKVPVDYIMMKLFTSTGVFVTNNHAYDDQKGVALNSVKEMDRFFRITVALNGFVGSKVSVGDTVYFVAAPTNKGLETDNKKDRNHWLTGKWIVYQETTSSDDSSGEKLSSILVLIRPTFVLNTSNTCISKPEKFFSIY